MILQVGPIRYLSGRGSIRPPDLPSASERRLAMSNCRGEFSRGWSPRLPGREDKPGVSVRPADVLETMSRGVPSLW